MKDVTHILAELVRNRILNVSLSNPIRCATDSFAGHGTFLYLSDMKRRFLRGGSPQWNQVDIPGETEAILRVKLNADIESPDTQPLYTLCEVFDCNSHRALARCFTCLIFPAFG